MEKNKNTKVELKNEISAETKLILPSVAFSTGHKINFELGQIVYLKTDNEQNGRMVTGIILRPNRSITYCLTLGGSETVHYGIEIDAERDIIKVTTG